MYQLSVEMDKNPHHHTRISFKNEYIVGHILGKGGFGTVYSAVRINDGKNVAIKEVLKTKVTDWVTVSFYIMFF